MYFKHGDLMVNTDGLRVIVETRCNPAGGRPFRESGTLEYDDGTEIETSLQFAIALSKRLLETKPA